MEPWEKVWFFDKFEVLDQDVQLHEAWLSWLLLNVEIGFVKIQLPLVGMSY